MKKFTTPLTIDDISSIQSIYGNYFKTVFDIEKSLLIVGCELHADGAELLLQEDKSDDENIWGGAFDLTTKEIFYSAVYNIRPRLNNNGMDILDSKIREKFRTLNEKFFGVIINE